jgi:PEP-CTERM motif-containing protein
MNRRSQKTWLFPVLIGLAMVLAPALLRAAPFQADFTNAAWTVNDVSTVQLTPTTATIGENQTNLLIPSVDLSQSFSIPAGATTLTFSILNLSLDPIPASGITPPFFTADLLDASNNSLVPAIPLSTDYYARDLTSLINEGAGARVTVTPANSLTTPITVTLDISSIPVNTVADLVFSVFPNGDGASTNASVEISDVTVNGTIVSTTPEPGSIVLLSMGVIGIAGHLWRKRAK